MPTIHLDGQEWTFDEDDRLGAPGGFGEVFRGRGAPGEVAVKRLMLTADAAAHRELKIGASLADRTLDHVVPVLDFGQDAESNRYFLVMPICDGSLQDRLAGGSLLLGDAKAVALDVLAGLREVGDLVHRDLKPGNILSLGGDWRIADFGIAKFVEDSTSLQTLRDSLTPLYGAPEQWLGERPSRATDVYALGCIFHAMLRGEPPFVGTRDDVRTAHLHKTPPPLNSGSARLDGLVAHMLRKAPAGRPSLARCVEVLNMVESGNTRRASAALAAAGQQVAEEEATAEAAQREQEARRDARQRFADEAIIELTTLIGRLFDEISASAESAKRMAQAISLGPAMLDFERPQRVEFKPSRSNSGWDVIAASRLAVRASGLPRSYAGQPDTYTWSANLVFARTPSDETYRWRELAFWVMRSQSGDTPVALSADGEDFYLALDNVMHVWNVAYGPFAIDAEDEEQFQHRWLSLFARAAQRQLHQPMQMPVPAAFFETL